jgi:hypothetical protein
MNNAKMIFFGITSVVLVLFSVVYFSLPERGDDEFFFIRELSLRDSSKLYIKKMVWGLTLDNQTIVISTSKDREFNNDTERGYFYHGLGPFYYKLENDTLSIYTTRASTVPAKLKTNFKVVQYVLDNPDMMNLIGNANYKSRGLQTID